MASLNFDVNKFIRSRGLQVGGRVQAYIDEEVIKHNEKYMPWGDDKGLIGSSAATDKGSGEVKYNAPQARFLYYGKLMVAKNGSSWAKLHEKKTVTGTPLKFRTDRNSQAQAFWFVKMKELHAKDILKGAQDVANNRSG